MKLPSKQTLILLGVIVVLGLFLRTFNMKDNFYFGHDQGRDIFLIHEMVTTPKLKIVGPQTDIPGLLNGPLYYYIMALPYALSGFNPNAGVLFHVLVNLAGIILIYKAGNEMVNRKTGIIAALLWAVSFEQINYAQWLSNPAFLSVASIIFFLGLYQYFIQKKEIGLPVSMLGLGLAIQIDLYTVYLLALYPLMYFLYPRKLNQRTLWYTVLVGGIFTASYIVAEIKFGFMGTRSLMSFTHDQSGRIMILNILDTYISGLSQSMYYSLLGINNFFALLFFGILMSILVWYQRFKKNVVFLFIWLFSTLPLFGFSGTNIVGGTFVHITVQAAVLMLAAYSITIIMKAKGRLFGYVILIVILCSNVYLFARSGWNASHILGHQNWVLSDQKKAIEYMYQDAHGQPFSICSVSNPLFINVHWSTLFKMIGEPKYGYLPFWSGPVQESNTFLPQDNGTTKLRYLILDPPEQLGKVAFHATILAEDSISVFDDQKSFGEINVQKRHIPNDPSLLIDTQKLTLEEQQLAEYYLQTDWRYRCNPGK